jgi:hypothetical protein
MGRWKPTHIPNETKANPFIVFSDLRHTKWGNISRTLNKLRSQKNPCCNGPVTLLATRRFLALNGQHENPNRISPPFSPAAGRRKISFQLRILRRSVFPKHLDEAEITWYMGMMGLRKQGSNGTDASGYKGGGDTERAIYKPSVWT